MRGAKGFLSDDLIAASTSARGLPSSGTSSSTRLRPARFATWSAASARAEQRVEIAVDLGHGRGAGADGGTDRQAVDKGCGLGKGAPHGLRGSGCFQRIGARQDGGKLLAAEPRHDAAAVEMRRCRGREQLEHAIAERVTEAVVGLFEMVEVEDQHRDLVSPPVLVLSEGIGGLEQSAPVGESGQRVGQSIDPLLQFLTLFGHGEHDEGQGDAEQQRDKGAAA